MKEAAAALIAEVLRLLPPGVTFKCGHAVEWGNVRLIAKQMRCRQCLNASSRRSYQKKAGVELVTTTAGHH